MADETSPAAMVGKRVTFKKDEEHADCWHTRNGLVGGVVLRVGQSLAQKAALLGTEGIEMPDMSVEESPRVWIKVDPCASYPRGCEVAAEVDCLTVS
jgi:hypothetical protein